MTEYPTSLGTSDADTITLLGQDLAEDLMGKVRDPRAPRLIEIATEEGVRGPHLRLFEAIGRVHP